MCGDLGDPLATGAPALEPPSPGVVSSDAPGAAAALPAPALCIPAQTGSSAQPADASTVTAAGAPSAVAGGPLVAGVPLAVANPSGRSFEAPLITATRPDTGSQMMVESVYTGQSAEAPSAPSAPSALPGVGAAPASTAPTAPIAVGDGRRDADATVVPSATAEPTLVEAGLNTQRAALRRVFEPASYLPVMFQQEGKLTSDAHTGVGAPPSRGPVLSAALGNLTLLLHCVACNAVARLATCTTSRSRTPGGVPVSTLTSSPGVTCGDAAHTVALVVGAACLGCAVLWLVVLAYQRGAVAGLSRCVHMLYLCTFMAVVGVLAGASGFGASHPAAVLLASCLALGTWLVLQLGTIVAQTQRLGATIPQVLACVVGIVGAVLNHMVAQEEARRGVDGAGAGTGSLSSTATALRWVVLVGTPVTAACVVAGLVWPRGGDLGRALLHGCWLTLVPGRRSSIRLTLRLSGYRKSCFKRQQRQEQKAKHLASVSGDGGFTMPAPLLGPAAGTVPMPSTGAALNSPMPSSAPPPSLAPKDKERDKDKDKDREGLFGRFKRQPESPVVIVSSRPTLQALVGPTGTRGGPSASDGMVREAFRSGDSDGSFAFDRDPRNATAFGRNTAGVGAGGSAGPSSPPSPSPFSPAPGGDVETGDGPSPVSAISALLKSADTYR
jgi:hypothetical protein